MQTTYVLQFMEPPVMQFSVRRPGRLQCILVDGVQPDTEAERGGLRVGHQVVRVNGVSVLGMPLPLVRALLLADPPVLVEFLPPVSFLRFVDSCFGGIVADAWCVFTARAAATADAATSAAATSAAATAAAATAAAATAP